MEENKMYFTWVVKKNGKVVAGFVHELDARQYMDLMRNLNRAAGYKDKYKVEQAGE